MNMVNKNGAVNYRVTYAQAVFSHEEKQAVLNSLNNPWLAAGPQVAEFERKIASLFGYRHGVATNSGSSANLLALDSLDLPKGSEVITPACTFSTTVSSIIQNNLVPVFVDSLIGRYTIDENLIEQAITEKTRVLMIPHLIGGVANLHKLRELADLYHLILIEDSCDTLGVRLHGKPSGHFADLSTTSFYGSHIITAMGYGGMLCMNDRSYHTRGILLKDWGRVNADGEDFHDRFSYEIDGIPYDSKFLYGEFGYNLKMNEAAAAFGLEQLKRLNAFVATKKAVFDKLYTFFKQYEKWFYLPELLEGAETNWLAFPLTIRKEAPFNRYQFLEHMENRQIQTRVLFAGNITRHPVYRHHAKDYKIASKLTNADKIMESGLLLGCHQGMNDEQVAYVLEAAESFLKGF